MRRKTMSHRYGQKKSKRFFEFHEHCSEKMIFFSILFLGKLDKGSKNFNFLMNIDSKTPIIDFFTLGFFEETLELFFFH